MDNKDKSKVKEEIHLIALNNMFVTKCKKEDISSIMENNPGSTYLGILHSK